MKSIVLILSIVALFSAGCSTTKASRQDAARLSAKVQIYRQEQQKRIENLNAEYLRTSTRLTSELDRLYEFQVDQSLDLSAMRMAEDLLTKWEDTTLPKQFRDAFAQALDENLAKLQAADAAMQSARTAYASSYRDAVLQLKKLDDVKSNLDTLSAKPSDGKELTELLRTLYALYQKSQKNTNSPTTGGK